MKYKLCKNTDTKPEAVLEAQVLALHDHRPLSPIIDKSYDR